MKFTNRKATFNYQIFERIETGIVLSGSDVKRIRLGKVELTSAHAKIVSGEVFLVGAVFDSHKSRKLLLHKKEIISLDSKMKQKKLTLVPLSLYTKGRLFKVELALARTKRKFEKKETLKKRDIDREIDRSLRT